MKNLIFIMLLLLLSNLYAVNPSILTIVCEDQEDFPYVLGQGSTVLKDNPGAVVEALRILEKQMGIKLNIVRVPWRRALEMELKNGHADALFHASYRKDREEFGVYPMKAGVVDENRKLFATTYSFYRIKDSGIEWDGKELKNFNGLIDAPRGYSIVQDLKSMSYKVDESVSTQNGFQKLLADRVQLVAALEFTGDYFLENNPDWAKRIEKIEKPIVVKAYYLMFSHKFYKENKAFAELIWDNLAKIRDTEFDKLMLKY